MPTLYKQNIEIPSDAAHPIQGHLKYMDWKVKRKFFNSLKIADGEMSYTSF